MFQPDKYKKKDRQYIFDFIKAHPFATFVIKGKELLATHIPILIKGDPHKFMLYGHIAQANEQYPHLEDGLEGILIFHGAQAYVSSSWYKEVNISTWDYSAVHVNVKLKLQSREELVQSLKELVWHFEKEQKDPIYYEDLPQEMIDDHLPLITGFWCEPIKVQAIAKLHQGFEKDDIQSVTRHLEERGDALSSELSKNIKKEHGTGN
ncbi:negative transcriptional regulator, PaiB family [Salinimicrobium catena]|uniref:Negative transcriptional regulator, PaiB family n=1 Tax=Salinimicrobium catena TaxID=390640 RepID=A0A1H5JV89_9FLAO|nr:FMN-binding negative transcriptional regulator [Salinimicrobium catena]SDK90594.1 negative transcriptional regulator, PaiB family [Salinimicrobium catena]SEE56177.1 negative transcriptional regulator, PaiB family [Salinimicrobium catena]